MRSRRRMDFMGIWIAQYAFLPGRNDKGSDRRSVHPPLRHEEFSDLWGDGKLSSRFVSF